MKTFNVEAYKKLILSLKDSGRRLVSFADLPDDGTLLRLDVDYDPAWAARLAGINRECGATGTFFVQAASPLYNLFSEDNLGAIRQIAESGQWIGLHFHHTSGQLDISRLEREVGILKMAAPEALRVVAWHNPPTDFSQINLEAEKAGFISAYADRFFGDGKYISDSNMRHDSDKIIQFAKNSGAPVIQVLLHPFNWVMGGDEMKEVLRRTFKNKFGQLAGEFSNNSVWRGGLGDEILGQMEKCPWYGGKP
ncbi:MAG: hypothetical protein HZB29_13630 [Nitrospinae bacterium]|nr:hypothetical protein [Nitrospinota bacterium]